MWPVSAFDWMANDTVWLTEVPRCRVMLRIPVLLLGIVDMMRGHRTRLGGEKVLKFSQPAFTVSLRLTRLVIVIRGSAPPGFWPSDIDSAAVKSPPLASTRCPCIRRLSGPQGTRCMDAIWASSYQLRVSSTPSVIICGAAARAWSALLFFFVIRVYLFQSFSDRPKKIMPDEKYT